MSHKHIFLLTASLLLLSPSAFAQSFTNNQPASALGNEPFESPVFVLGGNADTLQPEADTANPYWQNRTMSDFHMKSEDIGVEFTPGQYYGNKGPASEEQGIQLLFSSQ